MKPAVCEARLHRAQEQLQYSGFAEPSPDAADHCNRCEEDICLMAQAFLSQRTGAGGLLVVRAHCAARDAMKAICPRLRVGLTLSLHDLQARRRSRSRAPVAGGIYALSAVYRRR